MTNEKQRIQDNATNVATAAAAASTAAVLATNIEFIKKDLSEVKQTLKELSGIFVTKSEFAEMVKVNADQEERLRILEKSLWKFVGMGSAASTIFTLFASYIMKLF